MSTIDTQHYFEQGYAVARNVFTREEMTRAGEAIDRIKSRLTEMKERDEPLRIGNFYGVVEEDPNVGLNVRAAMLVAMLEPDLDKLRTDLRMLELVRPLLGDTLRQVTNQLHWKTPGSRMIIQMHTDRQNRKGAQGEFLRNMERSFIQTAIAMDPMTQQNGPLLVCPGSHRTPKLLGTVRDIYSQEDLRVESTAGIDTFEWHAEPGDVILWHPDVIHGSGINQHPTMDRRIYINGYVNAHDCLCGMWSFIKGQPVPCPPVDVPVMVSKGCLNFDRFPPQSEGRWRQADHRKNSLRGSSVANRCHSG